MTVKRIITLPLSPGIYTEETDRGATGRWKAGNNVRFRYGLPEKIGGWNQLTGMFLGTARNMIDWSSLDGAKWTAIGTDWKLYLWQSDGTLYDITPIRRTATLTDPFTTVNGSQIVTVTDASHSARVNDFVTFSGATAVGGLTIDGEYQIVGVSAFDTYTIDAGSAAISAATGGGTVSAAYQINTGQASSITGQGWGTCGWGQETWNTARTCSRTIIEARTWSLDNWGEDLIAAPFGGSIYWWDRTSGPGNRAVLLTEAPERTNFAIISQRDRHLFAMGATERFSGVFDPLLIRWCSQEDFDDWIPTSTNTSGDLRLYRGSRIITAVKTRGEILVFTDESAHSINYLGGFDVYGVNVVGENVSILGPNAIIATDYRVYLMGEGDWFMYDGVMRVLPSDVRNFVYENLNVSQKTKVFAGLNREFNEIWWFYPGTLGEQGLEQDATQTGDNPIFLYENEAGNIDALTGESATVEGAGLTLTTDQAKFGVNSVQGDGTTADNAISWTGSQYSLGTDTWTMHGWVYLPTGSFATSAAPLAFISNELPNTGTPWGGTPEKAWSFSFVPTSPTNFTIGWTYAQTNGSAATIGAALTNADFPLDTWNWVTAQRSAGNRIDVWIGGTHIANSTVPAYFNDDLNQILLGIGNANGWGAPNMRNWPGYIDNWVVTRDVLFNTTGQDITVPTTNPVIGFPSPEVNRYVVYNYEENTWATGALARTAWHDRSPILEKPYAAATDGYLYQHETGTDANGAALEASIESYDMELGEGEFLLHVDQLIPDFLTLEGSVDVELNGRKYPQDVNQINKGPYVVAPGTRKLSTRMRARQASLKISSNAIGDEWRMGKWRARVGPHGKRG